MSFPPTTSRPSRALRLVIATLSAAGGVAIVLDRQYRLCYASPLVATTIGDSQLDQPDLLALAEEAWAAREPVVRSYQWTDFGPFQEVVVQAGVVWDRWLVLNLIDRTQEVQAIQARQDVVANVGHELRTPVTSLSLIAQALHSCTQDPAAVAHFAGRLDHVSARLEELADGLLDLGRAQFGQPGQEIGLVDTAELVLDAVATAREAARSRGVKVEAKKVATAQVRGVRSELLAAIENLVSNAIQYSPPGSRVRVTSRVDRAEGTVTINVIDQGIGIEPKDQQRVFERFYRTDSARSRRQGGSGLGLAIVKHTALSHGGNVLLDSRVGAGSTFSLVLPLALVDTPAPEFIPKVATVSDDQLQRKTATAAAATPANDRDRLPGLTEGYNRS